MPACASTPTVAGLLPAALRSPTALTPSINPGSPLIFAPSWYTEPGRLPCGEGFNSDAKRERLTRLLGLPARELGGRELWTANEELSAQGQLVEVFTCSCKTGVLVGWRCGASAKTVLGRDPGNNFCGLAVWTVEGRNHSALLGDASAPSAALMWKSSTRSGTLLGELLVPAVSSPTHQE